MLYNKRQSLFTTLPVLPCVLSVTAIGVHLPFSTDCDKFSLLTMIQNQISDQTQSCIKGVFNMIITLVFYVMFKKHHINPILK